MSRIAGLILAAGLSRRLGRPKQLLPLGGETVIEHVVRRAVASALDDVLVVTGDQNQDKAIRDALSAYSVHFVHNPRFTEGQGTSLASGTAALSNDTDAVVVLLGDQPGIDPAVIDCEIAAYRQYHAPIIMARYGEERGHPVLFDRTLFPELAALDDDVGGRDIVRVHNDALMLVNGRAPLPPDDIDTEDAYQRLRSLWSDVTERALRDR